MKFKRNISENKIYQVIEYNETEKVEQAYYQTFKDAFYDLIEFLCEEYIENYDDDELCFEDAEDQIWGQYEDTDKYWFIYDNEERIEIEITRVDGKSISEEEYNEN